VFEVLRPQVARGGIDPQVRVQAAVRVREHDAERIFEVDAIETQESQRCISGLILTGG